MTSDYQTFRVIEEQPSPFYYLLRIIALAMIAIGQVQLLQSKEVVHLRLLRLSHRRIYYRMPKSSQV
jgi:hypothetical protein